ncbi:MAG TPA: A/G-specific adenine glycosylase [Candidatus Acidoferrum sp.]|nr:A/G-specific adenine glycosylase [Candidatus Acidoferrum sp.]
MPEGVDQPAAEGLEPAKPDGLDEEAFRAAVLSWYRAAGRQLGFRSRSDPYAVLVSETMAQQTQIGRVTDHWQRFLDRFPTFEALAAAPPADVLRAWRGLGYNRRALNLQRCARLVVEAHAGQLPADIRLLESLPGIGRYTARAVAALAFGLSVGPVDVNVRRVLGRAARIDDRAPTAPDRVRAIQLLADQLASAGGRGWSPAEWTHALMDVGATFCRPREPRCDACPARRACRSAGRVAGDSASAGLPRAQPGPTPFPQTRRWLRGRILDRLRDAGEGWTRFEDAIGTHDITSVVEALHALAVEGLVEIDPAGSNAARLPIA